MMATQEFVVPKSIPITFPMMFKPPVQLEVLVYCLSSFFGIFFETDTFVGRRSRPCSV
jgi:hypothetical protein